VTGAGRRLELGLRLLDHQIVDRDDWLAGNVDDLELTESDDGRDLYVTAIFSGPGVLWRRMGARRLGRWLEHTHSLVAGSHRARIPFSRVVDIGPHVKVALRDEEVGSHDAERWAREHVTSHIPGSRHRPPE
jgi:hypothetical protein